MTKKLLGTAPAVLALAIAGCGGGGGVSKSEYVSKADAICSKYNAKIKALGNPDPSELGKFVGKGKALASQELAELKALDRPDELKKDLDEVYGILDQEIAKFDDLQAAAEKQDAAAITKAVGELDKLDKRSEVIAKKIGMKACGATTAS